MFPRRNALVRVDPALLGSMAPGNIRSRTLCRLQRQLGGHVVRSRLVLTFCLLFNASNNSRSLTLSTFLDACES